MVQTYGVASPNDSTATAADVYEHPTTHVATEDDALLGGDSSVKRVAKREGHATLTSSVGNLANTIIGSGEYLYVQRPNRVGI